MARKLSISQGEVPYIPIKRIERDADYLLAEYADKFEPITEPPIPVEALPSDVLEIEFKFFDLKSMFPFADVHGAIWFEEARIGIDQSLNPDENPRRRGRYHFTLAHEIGHWRLHRAYYLENKQQQQLFDDGTRKPDVVCRSSERKKQVEWQADQYAACLLMPRKMLFAEWASFRGNDDQVSMPELRDMFPTFGDEPVFRRGHIVTTEEEINDALKEMLCKPLAERFAVSAETMKIRLEELELLVNEKTRMLF